MEVTSKMEYREDYYELVVDGTLMGEYIRYEDALEASAHYLDDDCVEIYHVRVEEEKVY